jgi:hypothetical protein
MTDNSYFIYHEGEFDRIQLEELAKRLSLPPDIPISTYSNEGSYGHVWSARLSTGLFGLTSCEPGNKGPKGYSEVILAMGDQGLKKLVELGFITCPACHPENIDGFWGTVQDTVQTKYGISTLEDFVDKRILPFDARRVEWEELLPVIGRVPNRLYIPKDLSDSDLRELNGSFANIGFALPPVGYYNPEVPERFTQYQIPTS